MKSLVALHILINICIFLSKYWKNDSKYIKLEQLISKMCSTKIAVDVPIYVYILHNNFKYYYILDKSLNYDINYI